MVHQLFAPDGGFSTVGADSMAELDRQCAAWATGAKRNIVQRAVRSLKAVANATRSELCQLMQEETKLGAEWSKRMAAQSSALTQIAAGLK